MKEMNKAAVPDLAHLPRFAVFCEETRCREVYALLQFLPVFCGNHPVGVTMRLVWRRSAVIGNLTAPRGNRG